MHFSTSAWNLCPSVHGILFPPVHGIFFHQFMRFVSTSARDLFSPVHGICFHQCKGCVFTSSWDLFPPVQGIYFHQFLGFVSTSARDLFSLVHVIYFHKCKGFVSTSAWHLFSPVHGICFHQCKEFVFTSADDLFPPVQGFNSTSADDLFPPVKGFVSDSAEDLFTIVQRICFHQCKGFVPLHINQYRILHKHGACCQDCPFRFRWRHHTHPFPLHWWTQHNKRLPESAINFTFGLILLLRFQYLQYELTGDFKNLKSPTYVTAACFEKLCSV